MSMLRSCGCLSGLRLWLGEVSVESCQGEANQACTTLSCAVNPQGDRKFQFSLKVKISTDVRHHFCRLGSFKNKYLFGWFCVYVCVHAPFMAQCTAQRTICESWFFPSTTWVPGFENRSSIRHDCKHFYPLSHPGDPQLRSEWYAHVRIHKTN